MLENLLFVTIQDEKSRVIEVNRNISAENLISEVNRNPGYLFYCIQSEKKQIYYAKMTALQKINEKLKENTKQFVTVKFKDNVSIRICLEEKLIETDCDILRDVYARSNKENIGNAEFSIFNTITSNNYVYARPMIDEVSFNNKNAFQRKLLFDNSIVPLKTGMEGKNGKTYAVLLEEDGELFFSLTNDKMLEIDYQYLVNGQHNDEYRPYFYEFYPDSNIKKQDIIQGQLYLVNLKSIKKKQISDSDDLIKGTIFFSASPIKEVSAYIEFLKESLDPNVQKKFEEISKKLDEIKAEPKKCKIEQNFMRNLPTKEMANINYKVTFYNVGQGNWIHIEIYKEKTLLKTIIFDIGIGNYRNKKIVDEILENEVRKLKENYMFILSHWDLDHIKGIVGLAKKQFETTWIVPKLPTNNSNAAKRLAAYLYVNTNITTVFVDNSLNGELIFENDYFMFGKGKGNGRKEEISNNTYYASYSPNNNLGLLLVIKTAQEKKMLFPGDCEYIKFPSEFRQPYEALVVPHHGAEVKYNDLNEIGITKRPTNDCAIFCVGANTVYPNKLHKETIENLGYELIETRSCKRSKTYYQLDFE